MKEIMAESFGVPVTRIFPLYRGHFLLDDTLVLSSLGIELSIPFL